MATSFTSGSFTSGSFASGVPTDPADRPFQFDRPAEHGLAGRSYGEGVLTTAEAREAVVDGIRDAVLAHYDPTDSTGRWVEPAGA